MGVDIVSGSQPLPEAEISVWGNFSLGGNICDTVDGGRYGGCCGCKHKFQGGGSFSWGDFTEGETLITPLRHVTSHGRGCRYALEVAATRKRRQTLDSVFTALRVCTARTMPWQDVCPSVCLSVCQFVRHTPVLYLNGYTYPQNIFTIR